MAGHEVYCVAAEGAERPLGEILEELLEEAIKAEGYDGEGGLSGRRCTCAFQRMTTARRRAQA